MRDNSSTRRAVSSVVLCASLAISKNYFLQPFFPPVLGFGGFEGFDFCFIAALKKNPRQSGDQVGPIRAKEEESCPDVQNKQHTNMIVFCVVCVVNPQTVPKSRDSIRRVLRLKVAMLNLPLARVVDVWCQPHESICVGIANQRNDAVGSLNLQPFLQCRIIIGVSVPRIAPDLQTRLLYCNAAVMHRCDVVRDNVHHVMRFIGAPHVLEFWIQ